MMRISVVVFLFVLVLAFTNCEKRTKVHRNTQNPDFMTPPDGRLYFLNVRSLYYKKVRKKSIPMDLYYYKTDKMPISPSIQFYIADNWMYDEAYLMPELDSSFGQFTDMNLSFTDTLSKEWHTFRPNQYNKENFLKAAMFLSNAIELGASIYIKAIGKDSISFLNHQLHREAIRITLKDYQTLRGIEYSK